MEDNTGYRPQGMPPKCPVEWSRWGPIDPQRVTATSSGAANTIFELNPCGWDVFSFRFSATGLATGDSVTVSIESPEGVSYSTVTATAGSGGINCNGALTTPIEVASDRYLVKSFFTTAAGTTECRVQIMGFLKGASREAV